MSRRTPPGPKQAAPVNWYAPGQLLRTGIEVLTSDVFGKRADSRRLSALGPKDPPFDPPPVDPPASGRGHDFESPESASGQDQQPPLWIDFAADCGDGFAATFAVASALASAVTVTGPDGRPLQLEAGRVLVLGGDQVYPTPSGESYEERFLTPYQYALGTRHHEEAAPERHLYAVPGNHDWYDGLVAFSRVFCTQSAIGPWQTRQHRSYFALRLSPLLWLLAVDTQICQDIDRDQLEYFREILRAWRATDETPAQVIVVTAEPHWEAVRYDGARKPPLSRVDICALGPRHLLGTLLCELEQQHARVVLQLTGDLHHYRRYASQDHCHLITAGGGGAFLHPTHTRVEDDPVREICGQGSERRHYVWQGADFPDVRSSRALAWHNLWFARDNPRFLALLGAVYLLLGLVMPVPKSPSLLGLPGEALMNLVLHTESAFVFLAVTGAVIAFTDTVNRRYKWVAGTLHALTHLTAALMLTWLLRGLRVELHRNEIVALHHVGRHLGFCASMVALGGVIGASLWGAYLLVSVNGFKRHSNEAFSSLGIEDYKCFVRMKLEGDQLTVYPLGLRQTPRAWHWQEQDRSWTATSPPHWELIEAPISIQLLKARGPLSENKHSAAGPVDSVL